MAKELIGNDWDQVLDPVFASEKYHELHNFLKEEYSVATLGGALLIIAGVIIMNLKLKWE